jgi:hypothetical protein
MQKENIRNQRNNYNNYNSINIINSEIDNYYDAILDYELKRQNGFDWDENKEVTPNLIVIKEFLNNLSEKLENNTEILKNFEKFLIKGAKWIKLSSKEIKTLYIGDEGTNDILEASKLYLNQTTNLKKRISSDFKYHSFIEFYDLNEDVSFNENEEEYYTLNYDNKVNGLFYIIGNYNNNIILSIEVLDFLNKLIDTEYNPDAEIYIKIFKSCEIKDYKLLNLNKIIKNNVGGNKNNLKVMRLLKLIFNDKSRDEFQRTLMEDDSVYKQYLNYLNKFIE